MLSEHTDHLDLIEELTLGQWRAHGYITTRERPEHSIAIRTSSYRWMTRPACPTCGHAMLEAEYRAWSEESGGWVLRLAYACVRTCPRPYLYATELVSPEEEHDV